MQGFAVLSKNKWFPLLMTSVIFGSLHLANPEVIKLGPILLVYYIGTGLFLGILTLMDDGMELSLGFHAANNLVGALLVTSDWSVFQTNSVLRDVSTPSAGYEVILPVFLIFPILLYIFSKKYNWTNWKEKLTGNIDINNHIKNYNNE
jgi:membrane protease YdiL (CAAX protease family)